MAKTTTFPFRYTIFVASIASFLVTLPLSLYLNGWYLLPVLFAALALLGTWDMVQNKHTVSRNYPILAPVPPSPPSTTIKSGFLPVSSMALTIANHSQG